MKLWPYFVLLTILTWGAYVPTIHRGQTALGKDSALRAFLFIGFAYFLVSVVVIVYVWMTGAEKWEFTGRGMTISTFAGVLGALGALGIAFALKPESGGKPLFVAPLVFAGAPIVNTLVAMLLDKPEKSPSPMFYVGILMAAAGAGLVLKYKPVAAPHAPVAVEIKNS